MPAAGVPLVPLVELQPSYSLALAPASIQLLLVQPLPLRATLTAQGPLSRLGLQVRDYQQETTPTFTLVVTCFLGVRSGESLCGGDVS